MDKSHVWTRPKLKSEAQDLEERRKCFVDQGSGGGGLRKKFACCGAGVSFHCFNAIFRPYHTLLYQTIPNKIVFLFFNFTRNFQKKVIKTQKCPVHIFIAEAQLSILLAQIQQMSAFNEPCARSESF